VSVQVARSGLWRPLRIGRVLWRFSRPHTIVGTTVSILALWLIAADFGHAAGPLDLCATLLAGWFVNVAIVGLNQVEDVEIDRVNKPDLPVAAGELGVGTAKAIVLVTGAGAFALAVTQGRIELVAVCAALAAGFAYSSPPFRLKRFPGPAMTSITLVRSLAVNLGVYGHFAGSLADLPGTIWALTLFTLPFGAAIAVLKDVPDVAGDRAFHIHTWSVRVGAPAIVRLALSWLTVGYLAMTLSGIVLADEVNVATFSGGHALLLSALLWSARRADPEDPRGFTRFYLRIWALFFCEYALVACAVAL
jgi:homogentisate phytyltransferase / homogentisate geranylgeranyltransferase